MDGIGRTNGGAAATGGMTTGRAATGGMTTAGVAAGARALLVVDERVEGKELRDALLAHLGRNVSEVFVVAPALADSALKHTMGDVDEAIEPARERLESALEALRSCGLEAQGEVGDSDPIQAISDELVKVHPDEVVVVAHSDGEGAFAEKGLLEQAERDLDMPVLEIVVDGAAEPRVLDVQRTEPVAGSRKGWRPSYNLPPFSQRELFGILVAVVGTIALGVIASKAAAGWGHRSDFEEGRLGAPAAAALLIAVGMTLINMAHVVGLFLFQAVGYRGMFSRFFARLSLFGTPIALGACLLLWLIWG